MGFRVWGVGFGGVFQISGTLLQICILEGRWGSAKIRDTFCGGVLIMRITIFCPHKFLDMFDKSWRFLHCLGSRIQRQRILSIWGFPKTRGTFFGVPILRILVFWGLYWGPPIWGKYHIYTVQGRFSILRVDSMIWVSFPCMSFSLNSLQGVI